MRTEAWLKQQLTLIWQNFFPDIERKNSLEIQFGRKCRNQMGSVKLKGKMTIITINGLFRNESIPDYVITATIAHELVHYAHGFSSPHPQLARYPHQGGIVTRELIERGLDNVLKQQKQWLKENWKNYLQKYFPHLLNRSRRVYTYRFNFWPF